MTIVRRSAAGLLFAMGSGLAFGATSCSAGPPVESRGSDERLGTQASALSACAASAQQCDALDWLIQDVCDSDPTADPFYCGARHNLVQGEWLRYDRAGVNRPEQRRNSFPAWSDGEVVVNSYDFTPFGVWNLDASADGYDVIETSPPFASMIETRDGGGLGASWLRWNGAEELNDSWVLFPTAVPAFGSTSSYTAHLHGRWWEKNLEARPGHYGCMPGDYFQYPTGCTDNTAQTIWSRQNKAYSQTLEEISLGISPKVLDSIKSTHYSGDLASATGKEVNYFTRPYGLTRWEAWSVGGTPLAQCGGAQPVACCSGPATETDQGKTWVRTDCRDWTAVVANQAGLDPRAWPAPVPKRPTMTWEAESMSHSTGVAYQDGWGGRTSVDSAGYLVFGPYTSALVAGPQTASFSMNVDYNATSMYAAQANVNDYTAGVIRNYNMINRQSFLSTFRYQSFDVDFTAVANHAHEFRLWWYRNTGLTMDRVRVGEPRKNWRVPMDPLQFSTTNPPMEHDRGHAGLGGWEVTYPDDAGGGPGFMLRGPYTYAVLAGERKVTFTLITDQVDPNDNTVLLYLRIFDATAGTLMQGPPAVRRSQFPAAGTPTAFDVPFNAIGNHSYEFQIYWLATSTILSWPTTVQ